MFSVNNFYNYLNHYLQVRKKDAVMKSFNPHGSRLLSDIIVPSYQTSNDKPYRYATQLVMFDQEPIQFEYFTNWINFDPSSFPEGYEYKETGELYKNLDPVGFIFRHFGAVNGSIIMHSERNSTEVEIFKRNGFKTVHYFYHGLIARDWFRHWAHYEMQTSADAKRLGMYCRDASGSRAYRLDLLRKLIPYKDNLYYNLQDPIYRIDPQLNVHYKSGPVEYNSDASAMIVPDDTLNFDIQLVPETLFDTPKTHLTEKVFKPMVMKQPFIIVGPPGSLAYLKSYGFRTFENYWDESYDTIEDADERMEAIMKIVDKISNMDDRSYATMIRSARGVALYNRQRFYSGVFEQRMLEELHNNLDAAFEEPFEETFLKYLDQLQSAGNDITDYNRSVVDEIAKYLLTHDPKRGRELMLTYKQILSDIV